MDRQIEKRAITELRATAKFALGGIAASYNTLSGDVGGFVEQIAPGAFARSLRENADVIATFNHDPNKVLGRTKSGTLTLSDSTAGLVWYCQLDPNNSDHQNIYASVKRGDISQRPLRSWLGRRARNGAARLLAAGPQTAHAAGC